LLDNDLTIAVVLASADRAELLGEVIRDIRAQTRPPQHLVVSVPDDGSLPPAGVLGDCQVVYARGLAAQRNAGIDAVPHADIVFFFDDDAVVRNDYLERGVAHFVRNPDVVGLTGHVLLDGAASAEISREQAEDALQLHVPGRHAPRTKRRRRTLYGCNFAYRAAATDKICFDDRLPAYSWLEDHDFARRLMRLGELIRADDCVIVHRGVKSGGRQAHRRLGYSQVMNPAYLFVAGSFPLWLALWEVFRPTAKNVAYAAAGGQRSWRRERLRGNAMAAHDVLAGRFTPERIREIEP
jgi:GT2 family glycosyltransferase